ncbi:unnamed protein product [Trichogramma brassicae]|uniref:Uncharacterized protein n=1 Tax=Trichogramma brassicae TaxID=86971 RepID=A0A6H5J2C5_9HYME|nr:unnamed protein product [Trichogramma brassicae]
MPRLSSLYSISVRLRAPVQLSVRLKKNIRLLFLGITRYTQRTYTRSSCSVPYVAIRILAAAICRYTPTV